MATTSSVQIRTATLGDVPQIRALIYASVLGLHTTHYTPRQITAALTSVYGVDTQLIRDATYFVVTPIAEPSTIVGCGGWSFRNTLYGGDQHAVRDDSNLLDPKCDAAKIRAFFVHPGWVRRGIGKLVLVACEEKARDQGYGKAEMGSTLPGVAFYESMGYVKGDKADADLGDGMVLEIVRMGKSLL